jgi:diaminopimelate decarboxylase
VRDALLQIAETVGTPTYVYEEPVIRAKCRALRDALRPAGARLLYAMKANSNPALLRLLKDEVDGLDAVSPAEVYLALRLGYDAKSILFSPNNTSREDMEAVHGTGVPVNLGELDGVRRFGEMSPGAELCVRLNPQIGAGHHRHVITGGRQSKFGLSPSHIPDLKAIAKRHRLRIVGLHQHIGSGYTDTDALWASMEFLLEAASSFPDLRFLNFGGGLGIAYRTGDTSFDISGFQEAIGGRLNDFRRRDGRQLALWFEPGRYLTAESGTLLVRVTAVKRTEGGTFVGTDSGFNHLLRPILYGAFHGIFNLSNPTGELEPVHVAGNICEAGDLFATDRALQHVREGDILAILDTGAYGMAMASTYNLRSLPAEVLIAAGGTVRLIRARKSPADFVGAFLADHTDLPI